MIIVSLNITEESFKFLCNIEFSNCTINILELFYLSLQQCIWHSVIKSFYLTDIAEQERLYSLWKREVELKTKRRGRSAWIDGDYIEPLDNSSVTEGYRDPKFCKHELSLILQ